MSNIRVIFFVASCIFLVPIMAHSKSITPSHVYQVADSLVQEVLVLSDANYSDTTIPNVPVVPGKFPRHVIQKGQEILRQLETLMRINGQVIDPIEPVPVEQIKPANVMRPVMRALTEIRKLKPLYKVDPKDKEAPFVDGKKPSDVYARLTQASMLIQRLDLPKPVPNDVHRSALAILADLKIISQQLKMPAPSGLGQSFKGKKPGDVYSHARTVLQTLQSVVKSGDAYAIPGGITVHPVPKGPISPGHVLEMQNTILAELSSLKVKVGATKTTPNISTPSGKTPSDVFASTNDALMYSQSLLALAQAN